MKHRFYFKYEPSKTLIDNLIEICTADGSTVDKIQIDYEWVRGFVGNKDLIVKIWTKKEQSK